MSIAQRLPERNHFHHLIKRITVQTFFASCTYSFSMPLVSAHRHGLSEPVKPPGRASIHQQRCWTDWEKGYRNKHLRCLYRSWPIVNCPMRYQNRLDCVKNRGAYLFVRYNPNNWIYGIPYFQKLQRFSAGWNSRANQRNQRITKLEVKRWSQYIVKK